MPIAPTTLPSCLMGMPPAKIMTLPSLEAWMPEKLVAGLRVFAEVLGSDVEGAGGPGFLLRDVDGAKPGVLHALESEEVASGVDDGDVHGLTDVFGLLGSGGDDAAGVG